jgi:hypothetical protein
MAQIFHRSFNTISRVSIFGAVFILAGVAWAYGQYIRSDYATGKSHAVDQPIPFSHKHHVTGLGIDCRYCHTSVENAAYAGIPPTHTCMNCHQQIWVNSPLLEPARDSYDSGKPIEWVRVHNLADFVYFDHSIHVKKGFGCATCHGPVQEMNLTYQFTTLHMEWCLDCHRNPEKYVRPRDEVFNMHWQPHQLQEKYGLTPQDLLDQYKIKKRLDCSVCHR